MKTAMSKMNQMPDPDLVGDAPARYAIGAMLGAGAGIDNMVGGTLPCGGYAGRGGGFEEEK